MNAEFLEGMQKLCDQMQNHCNIIYFKTFACKTSFLSQKIASKQTFAEECNVFDENAKLARECKDFHGYNTCGKMLIWKQLVRANAKIYGNAIVMRANAKFLERMQYGCVRTQGFTGKQYFLQDNTKFPSEKS